MSTVHPPPRPTDPLQFVLRRWTRGGAHIEQLECGHRIVDSEGRKPRKRRCRQCGEDNAPLIVTCPQCGAAPGEHCTDGGKGCLRVMAPGAHESRARQAAEIERAAQARQERGAARGRQKRESRT